MSLRVRRPRSVTSTRIQALALTGATGGLLTPREVKEVCLAVVAETDRQSLLPERKSKARF